MSVGWIVLAAVCLALSGVPAVLLRSRAGGWMGVLAHVGACVLAAMGMADFIHGTGGSFVRVDWSLPVGRYAVGIDALSGFFLIPILLIATLGSIYGLSYWSQAQHPGSAARLRLCWGILAGAMVMIVVARDGVLFLMAWEVMALAGFMLIATEDHKGEVRRAAWIYQMAAHLGTLCLIGFFALLRGTTGSFDLWPALNPATAPLTGLFVLGLIGFGMKAGLFPLHVWLPGAHANAPSHVSAILSGVMLKMGVYGLLRMTGLVTLPPVWWGALMLGLGTVSAVLGIAYAVGQKDYKKLLAYSSIENIGIVTMGLGLALLGRAAGRPEWVVLGMAGALLHVLNHSLFKPMLFMGAGNLLHAVHTRNIDRLGGLGKKMPWTYGVFLLGAIAICGLPPMNGFVSELLIYLGLLGTLQEKTGTAWGWAALAVPALAAVGALAVSAFVKLIGGVFQGEARHGHARHAHDPGRWMLVPLLVLAGLCVMIGMVPVVVLPLLEPAIGNWSGVAGVNLQAHLPGDWQRWLGAAAAGGLAVLLLWLILARKSRTAPRTGTWDCGYVRPTARMQYTGTSFGQMIVDLFMWALFPRTVRVRLRHAFPHVRVFSRSVPDAVLDRVLAPSLSAVQRGILWVRGLQQGSVQAYLVYVLLILVVLVLVGS